MIQVKISFLICRQSLHQKSAHTFFEPRREKFILWNFRLADEPRCEKTGIRGFRPGPTQTGQYIFTKEYV